MIIDRKVHSALQNDIRLALAEIAKKYGLDAPSIDLRRDRAGAMVRLMKLDMRVTTVSSVDRAREVKAEFGTEVEPALARRLKLMGITSVTNSKGERIVAYKPSRYVYPFVFQGPRGGRWKATEADILAKFS